MWQYDSFSYTGKQLCHSQSKCNNQYTNDMTALSLLTIMHISEILHMLRKDALSGISRTGTDVGCFSLHSVYFIRQSLLIGTSVLLKFVCLGSFVTCHVVRVKEIDNTVSNYNENYACGMPNVERAHP